MNPEALGSKLEIVRDSIVTQFPEWQKRLEHKGNQTKYRKMTRKPRSHVGILIYRTWEIQNGGGTVQIWGAWNSTAVFSNIYKSRLHFLAVFRRYFVAVVSDVTEAFFRSSISLGAKGAISIHLLNLWLILLSKEAWPFWILSWRSLALLSLLEHGL